MQVKLAERKRTRASCMLLGFMRKVVSTKKMELMEEHKKTMKLRKKYGEHVTPLQALWRGYYSRKTIMDFYKRKALLEVSAFFERCKKTCILGSGEEERADSLAFAKSAKSSAANGKVESK